MANKKTPTEGLMAIRSKQANGTVNYTNHEMIKIFAESNATLKQIIYKQLENADWSIVQMKKFERDVLLFNEINMTLDQLGQKTEKLLADNLKVMVKGSVLTDAYLVEQFSRVPTKLTMLNKDTIMAIAYKDWYGASYSDNIWKNTTQLKYVLKDQLMQSMILGENPKKLAKRINDVMGRGTYNAVRLARTEMIAAGARAQEAFAKENEDIIEGLKWCAHIDSKTSSQCLSHHGQVKTQEEWESSGHSIPCHPNCRCSYTMEVKDKYKVNKQVQSFDDWLKEKREQGLIVDGEGYMKPHRPKQPKPTPRRLGSAYTDAFTNQINSFTKLKDVQAYVQQEFKHMSVNFGRMDITSAKQISIAMAEMADKYPYVMQNYVKAFGSFTHYKNLGGGSPPSSKKTLAFYCLKSPYKHLQHINGIYFNSRPWQTNVLVHKHCLSKEWHVPVKDTAKSTIFHEFGHTLVDYITYEHKDILLELQAEWNAFSRYDEATQIKKLSGYGMSSFDEFCAESWAEYMCNDNPRETAKRVGTIMAKVAK